MSFDQAQIRNISSLSFLFRKQNTSLITLLYVDLYAYIVMR